MTALILTIALSIPTLPIIEVCEINQSPVVRQMILHRWTWLPEGHSHHVSQWWIIRSEPTIERRCGMWLVSSEGKRFVARSLRRTRTPRDPEILDRKKLNEMDRKAYLDD